MATAILMPQVGQDIETAHIIEWYKQENDLIRKGDIIASVESDKATFDVEAYESGVLLKIVHQAGEEVTVLTPIAYLGQSGETQEPTTPQGGRESSILKTPTDISTPATSNDSQPSVAFERVAASPSARRVARERKIDLSTVVGSGPGGRITKADVIAGVPQSDDPSTVPTESGSEIVPFSPMRGRIAERLTLSTQTIPHFYLFAEVDMTRALAFRAQINGDRALRITVTDMIVLAAGRALTEYPRLNAHVEKDRTLIKKAVNIGIAVSVPDGLAVPVIENCQDKTLQQVSTDSRQHVEAIRRGKSLSNAVGSFTVSNLGMYAIDKFLPIINPPECAILAVGQASDRPVVIQGEVRVRKMMTLTLACDHRAVDGTVAAGFLESIRKHFEDPKLLENKPR